MALGTNQDQGQRFNRRVILECIRVHGALSRAELSRHTGLSYQTAANLAAALLDEDILLESRHRDGRRGQPPLKLAFNPAGRYSVGISCDHRQLSGVLVDLAGQIRQHVALPIERPEPGIVIPLIKRATDMLLGECAVPRDRVEGMGVVMPGLSKRGELVGLAPSPANTWLGSWRQVPIVQRLSAATGLSVLADGDATAAAIGERLHGAGRTMRDFLYVYIASGLGAGIIISGRPYRGRFGKAGELGHMVVVPDGRPCPCGNRGCLERYASLSAAQASLTGRAEGSEPTDPDKLAEAFASRDVRLLAWLEEATCHLRTAIAMLENMFDPETIYIGGTLAAPLLDEIFARLEPLPRSVSTDRPLGPPRLTKANPGLETAALGAASLVFFESTSVDAQA